MLRATRAITVRQPHPARAAVENDTVALNSVLAVQHVEVPHVLVVVVIVERHDRLLFGLGNDGVTSSMDMLRLGVTHSSLMFIEELEYSKEEALFGC